jgi:hypothetical protein
VRCEEPGWEEIGKQCSAGRRSLWLRINYTPEEIAEAEANLEKGVSTILATVGTVSSIELCAGREGDDDYVRIERTHPLFAELLGVFLTALFAAST